MSLNYLAIEMSLHLKGTLAAARGRFKIVGKLLHRYMHRGKRDTLFVCFEM